MFILTADRKNIVDTSFVERFCYIVHPDAVQIIASYSADRFVTLGKYANRQEADAAFSQLFRAVVNDEYLEMPDSVLWHEERRKHDARTARKGGS